MLNRSDCVTLHFSKVLFTEMSLPLTYFIFGTLRFVFGSGSKLALFHERKVLVSVGSGVRIPLTATIFNPESFNEF